jgi:hypothetical protein
MLSDNGSYAIIITIIIKLKSIQNRAFAIFILHIQNVQHKLYILEIFIVTHIAEDAEPPLT